MPRGVPRRVTERAAFLEALPSVDVSVRLPVDVAAELVYVCRRRGEAPSWAFCEVARLWAVKEATSMRRERVRQLEAYFAEVEEWSPLDDLLLASTR
jgi:hypothetical protein